MAAWATSISAAWHTREPKARYVFTLGQERGQATEGQITGTAPERSTPTASSSPMDQSDGGRSSGDFTVDQTVRSSAEGNHDDAEVAGRFGRPVKRKLMPTYP
jgi:hypothetical protein